MGSNIKMYNRNNEKKKMFGLAAFFFKIFMEEKKIYDIVLAQLHLSAVARTEQNSEDVFR